MTTRLRTVESVTEVWHGDAECWHVVTRAVGDCGITHVVPKVTLEWRAAEYGIDPDDTDTLIDMVLHEQLPDADPPEARQGIRAARSTAEARQTHLGRIARIKAGHRIVLGGKGSPIDVIRARPGIDADGVRIKRQLVDVHRWRRLYGDLPVSVTDAPEVPRA